MSGATALGLVNDSSAGSERENRKELRDPERAVEVVVNGKFGLVAIGTKGYAEAMGGRADQSEGRSRSSPCLYIRNPLDYLTL